MNTNLYKPKVRIILACVVILLSTVYFIKNNILDNSKQIGYISMVYEESGKRYLRFDDVKFLKGNAAIKAAKKNGTAIYENGEYYVDDDYYIINNNKVKKNYVIDPNASLNLLGFLIDPIKNDINNHSASYNTLKSVSNKYPQILCYIYTKHDVIVKVVGQYTP
ncbi:hypothetical protein [Clostridium lacusfryxellense]|uniref:hypothetical protein n=1 Tax=Clostridium lacusfryxellense TaxID=205328 RepID=UPI001C0C1229|nr:hypothetical protein [Clostridium lacusfryxellense]MBU3112333.1 hypothetical protein [Clostridium lacusfryxellense]